MAACVVCHFLTEGWMTLVCGTRQCNIVVCTFSPFCRGAKKPKNDVCGTYDFLGETKIHVHIQHFVSLIL